MDDPEVLDWIRRQAAGACSIFSVCTGALICGAAGLLRGRRATTHWSAFHLLPFFGAIPVNERVVVDGAWIFAAGVTAGIDGALRLAAELRGDAPRRLLALRGDIPHGLPCPFQYCGWRCLGRAAVEGRLRRIDHMELDGLSRCVAPQLGREPQRAVDSGRDAGGEDPGAVDDHPFIDGDGAEERQ